MKNIKMWDVVTAIQGQWVGAGDAQQEINDVSIDSRKITPGTLFFAIAGDRFDGHDFVQEVYEKKAVCCISEKDLSLDYPYIKVASTKQALMDFAAYYRSLFDIQVVAITGSAGKTTTKDLVASVLSEKYTVLKTEGNFNNEIGLPLTLFRLDDTISVAVLEMGMNHFGEIHNLSKIARPDICVITNIGASHIEFLGSREGILKAKWEIVDFMNPQGYKVLNGDDDLLNNQKGQNTIFFGTENDNNFRGTGIQYNGLEGSTFTIQSAQGTVDIQLNTPGRHMILNALAAATVGDLLGLTKEQIKKGIEEFSSGKMRMEQIETKRYKIINDVYNANPESMKAALDVLAEAEGNRVCILGDMLELGEHAASLHYDVGKYAYQKGINVIVCVGKKAYNIYEGASKYIVQEEGASKQRAIYFDDKDIMFANMDNFLQKGDTILVKASRGMQFEHIIEKLV